jgi:hypothetical protein
MTAIENEREALAQVIADSFYAMQAGYQPTEAWEMPEPSAGDMQLAHDILAAGFRRQGPITDAQVEAAAESLWRHDTVDDVRLAYARAALKAARDA